MDERMLKKQEEENLEVRRWSEDNPRQKGKNDTVRLKEDRCHLGLRRLIGSRHQSSRPQGWKSAGQDINLPDLKDGRVPYHLSKSRMISSPFQNCRTGVILAFVGQDINLPDLKDGRVPYHLSKSRMISSPFQNCRTGVILAFVGQDINLPDLKDGRVSYHLSKSRMISSPFQNCRTGWRSATPGENNHAERCSLKENTKKREESQTLSLLKQTLLDKHLWIL
ncbi:hypothetical protein GQ457_18G017240 [Hibiscus cannabinus]